MEARTAAASEAVLLAGKVRHPMGDLPSLRVTLPSVACHRAARLEEVLPGMMMTTAAAAMTTTRTSVVRRTLMT